MDRYAPLRRRTIALVGLMGVGKSSVGRRLANALELPFRDADAEVEAAAGRSISDIFSDLGEAASGAEPQTPEDVELGRKLGAETARQLTLDLQNAGLPAVQAAGQAPPQPNDIVIKGNFYGVEEGSTGKRVLLGFGSGTAELRTAVEVYQSGAGMPIEFSSVGGGDCTTVVIWTKQNVNRSNRKK